jgi:FAD/FMN-containing dehydrogenase
MDGTVPLGQLSHVLEKTSEIIDHYGLRVANVFHAGDGNMHPLILFDANDPEESMKAEMAGNDILKLCVDAGGCLTGEHGVGIEKRDLMRHQYTDADLAQQMRVRAAFDPQWILNPSKVFPLERRNGSQAGDPVQGDAVPGRQHERTPAFSIPKQTMKSPASLRPRLANRGPIEIRGGGTKRGYGPGHCRWLRRCRWKNSSGITNYDPSELVMAARAGTPLEEIEAALAANNQMLTFEPMDHRPLLGASGVPTIGGVFAGNISGPRRIAAGAARDSLLGVRFVNGSGEIIKSGGRVMKNVTGLDLVKLMAGSWGTLGVLCEVIFKVLPRPETAVTIVLKGLNDAEAAEAMAAAMGMSVEVSGAAHLPESVIHKIADGALKGGPATVMRLEGLEPSVAVRRERLLEEMRRRGEVSVLEADETTLLWRDIRDVKPFAGRPGPGPVPVEL